MSDFKCDLLPALIFLPEYLCWKKILLITIFIYSFSFSDPVSNLNSNQRSSVQQLLEKLILEEDQFDVHDILPNTVPDPASLTLESDYACPAGEMVMAPDCGKYS